MKILDAADKTYAAILAAQWWVIATIDRRIDATNPLRRPTNPTESTP